MIKDKFLKIKNIFGKQKGWKKPTEEILKEVREETKSKFDFGSLKSKKSTQKIMDEIDEGYD